jgi:hypothetical protein
VSESLSQKWEGEATAVTIFSLRKSLRLGILLPTRSLFFQGLARHGRLQR